MSRFAVQVLDSSIIRPREKGSGNRVLQNLVFKSLSVFAILQVAAVRRLLLFRDVS